MKGKITRNFCLFGWILLSAYLLVTGIHSGTSYIITTVLGSLLGTVGIACIYEGFFGWFLFDIGIGFLIYPVSKVFGLDWNFNRIIKLIFLGLSVLLSMELFFDDSLRNNNAKRRCTIPFEAKCVSFAQAGASTYIPIYRYHIDGKTSMFYGTNLSSANPRLGEIITVFVNKKNENDVYCPTAKAILMLRYLAGFLILSFTTGALMIL